MYFTYIIYSAILAKFYIGSTSDLQGRMRRHNTLHSGFSGHGADWELRWYEAFDFKEQAIQRERQIKAWKSRKMIEKLVKEFRAAG